MFEITWWCVVVSLLLGTGVWLDARRNGRHLRIPATVWAVIVGATWVGLLAYVALRMRKASKVRSQMSATRGSSVIIAGDAERLWDMVTDVTRMGEWSPETQSAAWIDGASGVVVGALFRGQNRRGRARWSTVCEVIEAERGRTFAFAVGGAARPQTVWRYCFEPMGDGVRVTETFELVKPPGFLQRLLTRLTTGVTDRPADLEAGVRTTLDQLKVAYTTSLETSPGRRPGA